MWLGVGVQIKSGVEIGDGAIVGMGSIVTKNIPAYEVWAGNPARFIRKRFPDETINELKALKWWEWSEEKLAETGMGKPVTTHMRKITKKGVPLAIYDTRGFELGKEVQTEVKKEVIDTISKGLATQDINKAIHCISS